MKLRGIIRIFLILGILLTGAYMSVELSKAQSRIDGKKDAINKLIGDIAEIRTVDNLRVADVQANLASAKEAGDTVSALQNKYAELSVDKLRENTDALSVYFMPDDSGAKSMWYLVDEVKDAKWEFNTPYQFNGNYANVLWQCKRGDDLLAYVTATYDVSANKFLKVTKNVTHIGNKAMLKAVEEGTLKQRPVRRP